MTVTVVDSTNLVASVQAEVDAAAELQTAQDTGKAPAAKPAQAETKDAKSETKPTNGETTEPDPDDVEGDDGLTPRQKREMSASMLKAIGKKHRMMKEAEEFAAAQYSEKQLAEQRAQLLESELAALKAKAQPEAAKLDAEAGKPQRDKFPTGPEGDAAYWDAVIDWRADRRADAKFEERTRREEMAAAERRRTEIIDAATARIAAARAAVPDYDDVRASIPDDVLVPPVVAGYMEKSEMIAELAYHLAKHPEVLAKISKLPPDEQLVTIGKIESTLRPFVAKPTEEQDGATPSSKESTNGTRREAAPSDDETGTTPSKARGTAPVIKPLNGSGASAVDVDPRDMNIRETISDWSKKHQVNFGVRKRH
jgi:hypothetical protein